MARRQEWYTAGDDGDEPLDANATQWAQTFTLGTTGTNLTFNITQIKVKLKNTLTPTGNSTWEIQGVQPDGSPDGTALSTGTLDMATVTTTAWFTITMTSTTLEAGQQYALVCTDGYDSASAFIDWRSDANGSLTYTGGNLWDSADTGATWTDRSNKAAMFQIEGGTYDGTLCTLADAVNKMGANASAGGTSEVLVSDYVRQAEGVINAVTRFDWVGAYAGLTDEVRFILNQVASDLAAIYGITYDMSAYTADTVEAETMLNIYREAVARGLSLLRNQEVKRFIENDT